MHGSKKVKFANPEKAKQIYQEKKTKEKFHKTNASICYKRTCRQTQLTPNHISIKVKGNNRQCLKKYKQLHTILQTKNSNFYIPRNINLTIHLECVSTWHNS